MPRAGDYVYHRKDGTWEARYVKEISPDGKKKYGSVYGKTCKEVKEKRQTKQEYYLLNPPPMACASKLTIRQLAEEWLYVNQSRLKPATFQKYQGFCKNHLFPVIGAQRAAYITTAQIQAFALNRMELGLNPSSVNSVLTFLHGLLKYGHRQYKLPFPEIIYLTCERKEMRVLTVTEQQNLVRYLLRELDICKLGVLLALYTGLRVGELCALYWSNITEDCLYVRKTMQRLKRGDANGTHLHVGPPKTQTSVRVIPLPTFLSSHIETFRREDTQYFLSTPDLPVIEPRVMQNHFRKYLEAANIDKANFHSLRHTFATRCVECEFDIKTLSDILGHANVQITLNRYVHSSMALKRSNMEKLGRFL